MGVHLTVGLLLPFRRGGKAGDRSYKGRGWNIRAVNCDRPATERGVVVFF